MQSLLQVLETIQEFIAANTATISEQPEVENSFMKAGVLPFCDISDRREYMFMKPASRHGDDPGIQIAKGSRLYKLGDNWEDSKERPELTRNVHAIPENILITALREGYEELGLNLQNIKWILSGSIQPYRVKGIGEGRRMFLVPIEVKNKEDFHLPVEEGVEIFWFDKSRFGELRPDYTELASKIDTQLR